MPKFIEDFLYGAKIVGEYVTFTIVLIVGTAGSMGAVMGTLCLAQYIAGNNPLLFFIVLPIQLVVMGGLGYAFYNLIIRKWSEFCKRKKQRQHLNLQKSKFRRMSKSIERR